MSAAGRRPVSGSTLSDGLLIAAALAIVSFGVIAAPLQRILGRQSLTFFHWLELLYIPLTLAFTAAAILLSRRSQRARAAGLPALETDDPLARELAEAAPELVENGIAVAIYGSHPPADPDPTVPVEPPRILLPGTSSPLLIIASRTYARLRTDLAAFRAVLLHEIGHDVLRDTQRIDDIRRFMAVAIAMSIAVASASVYVSYRADCSSGFCRDALVAAIIGKGVLWSAIALAVVFAGIRRAMEAIREQIADNYVFEHSADTEALERAERLLGWESPHHGSIHRRTARRLPLAWWLLFGAAAAIVALNVSGISSYASELLRAGNGRFAELFAALAAASLDHIFVLFAFLVLSRELHEQRSVAGARAVPVAAAAFLAAWGAWLAYVVVHVFPAAAVGWIPAGYDYVFRSDVPALLFQTFTTTLHTNLTAAAVLAALLLICVAVPERWLTATRAAIFLVIVLSGVAEVLLRSGTMQSLGFGRGRAVLLAAAAALACAATAVRRRGISGPRASLTVIAGTAAIWIGLSAGGHHEMSLDTWSAMRAAAAARERNDLPRAIELLAPAAAATPQVSAVWMELGMAYSDAERLDEAIAAFDHAARLRGLASWNDRLYCYYRTADALIDRRRPADLVRARELLREVVKMHRANGRLEREVVAGALFVYGGVLAQSREAADRAMGMLYLVEAEALVPGQRICFLAATNPQLQEIFAPLRLREGPYCELPLSEFRTPEMVYASLARQHDAGTIECFARLLVMRIAQSSQ